VSAYNYTMSDKKTHDIPAAAAKPHTIIVDNRKKAQLTGVTKVIAATATRLALETSLGGLVVEGSGLAISKYNDIDGSLTFDGHISNLKYLAAPTSLVKKFFK